MEYLIPTYGQSNMASLPKSAYEDIILVNLENHL